LKKTNRKIVNQYVKDFEKFLRQAEYGFYLGQKSHGEHSNKKMNLIKEIKAELRDVACYAFFQFRKMNKLEEKIRRLKCM